MQRHQQNRRASAPDLGMLIGIFGILHLILEWIRSHYRRSYSFWALTTGTSYIIPGKHNSWLGYSHRGQYLALCVWTCACWLFSGSTIHLTTGSREAFYLSWCRGMQRDFFVFFFHISMRHWVFLFFHTVAPLEHSSSCLGLSVSTWVALLGNAMGSDNGLKSACTPQAKCNYMLSQATIRKRGSC